MTAAEASRIHDRIKALVEVVGTVAGEVKSVAGDVKAIKSACKPCQQRMDHLNSDIGGNGSKGLKTRVAVLENSRKETSKGRARFKGAVGNAIAATIAAVVGGLVVAFFVS